MPTPRDRIRNTLAGQTPDRLPLGELVVDLDLARDALGLDADAAVPLAAEAALLDRWGHDLVVISFSHGWGAPQQPDEEDAFFRLSHWQEHSDRFVFALVDGPFSIALKTWGWEQGLARLHRGESDVAAFMADAVVDLSELLTRIADAGADGIVIGDDIAYRRGPYIRPQVLRSHYFPFLNLLTFAAEGMGLPVVFHSDGNLWPVWDDLLAVGINGVHGLDAYSAMSLALARSSQRAEPVSVGQPRPGLADPTPHTRRHRTSPARDTKPGDGNPGHPGNQRRPGLGPASPSSRRPLHCGPNLPLALPTAHTLTDHLHCSDVLLTSDGDTKDVNTILHHLQEIQP